MYAHVVHISLVLYGCKECKQVCIYMHITVSTVLHALALFKKVKPSPVFLQGCVSVSIYKLTIVKNRLVSTVILTRLSM